MLNVAFPYKAYKVEAWTRATPDGRWVGCCAVEREESGRLRIRVLLPAGPYEDAADALTAARALGVRHIDQHG